MWQRIFRHESVARNGVMTRLGSGRGDESDRTELEVIFANGVTPAHWASMSNNQRIFTGHFTENCSPADINDGSGLHGRVPVRTAQSHLRTLDHRAATIAAGFADRVPRHDDQGKTIWSEVELAIEPGATPSQDAGAVLFDCVTRPIFAVALRRARKLYTVPMPLLTPRSASQGGSWQA